MEIKFIDVKYKDTLENFDINFKEENIVTIIDEFDKTDILRLISGDIPDDGKILIGDISITRYTDKSKIKNMISYSHCDTSLDLFNVNVLEDLRYLIGRIDNDILEEYLKKFSLNLDLLNKTYFELSSGEKRKLSLISTLLSDKQILLFENPTSNLDSKSIETLTKELINLKRQNKIIIIVTLDTDFALRVADKVLIMDDKKIMMYSDKYTAFSNDSIINKKKIKQPELIRFVNRVSLLKNKKLSYRDDVNDTIKDVYRSVGRPS